MFKVWVTIEIDLPPCGVFSSLERAIEHQTNHHWNQVLNKPHCEIEEFELDANEWQPGERCKHGLLAGQGRPCRYCAEAWQPTDREISDINIRQLQESKGCFSLDDNKR